MHKNLMVDLETLATTPDALVLSIGACAFDEELGVGPSMGVVLDRGEQHSRFVDPATQLWWSEQPPEARKIFDAEQARIGTALGRLHAFLLAHCAPLAVVQVWGNGSDFDLSVLCHLYRWHGGVDAPWHFLNHRCFRTLKNLMPADYRRFAERVRRRLHHDAEDDARWQAEVAVMLLRKLDARRRVADAAFMLADASGSLAFGPVMPGEERDRLQDALDRCTVGAERGIIQEAAGG